jgi:hypothetical protein
MHYALSNVLPQSSSNSYSDHHGAHASVHNISINPRVRGSRLNGASARNEWAHNTLRETSWLVGLVFFLSNAASHE